MRDRWISQGLVACLLACAACGGDESGERPVASGPLEVGFGRTSLAWRVGAKPGQVGTAALPERDLFYGEALVAASPYLSQPTEDMLAGLTEWAQEQVDAQVRATEPGAYSRFFEPSQGIELPPEANAVVVRRGRVKVALVRADLFIMQEHIQRRVAELVEDETGIGRDQLFLVGTHNHSTPHSLSPSPGIWTRSDAFDPRHFVYVTRQVADAVLEADRNLEPAELRVARTDFDQVQHNIIGPSEVAMEPPGGGDMEDVQVGYPYDYFDDDLLMLRFDSPDGEPIGMLFVFGMHPESLPEGHGIISGEWPTHVQHRIRERQGIESMWLPGPLGDVEPDRERVDPEHGFFRGGFDTMDQMTELVTGAVLDAWDTAGAQAGDPTPPLDQVARDVPGPVDYPIPDLAEIGARLPMVRIVQDSTVMRLHLVRLGEALLIGVPAEITTDLALNIKSRVDPEQDNVHQGYLWPDNPDWVRDRVLANFGTTELPPEIAAPTPMIVSHANGYFGYVVSRWEYENRDHYRQSMTFFGPGTADHIAGAVVELGRELAREGEAQFEHQPWHELDREQVEGLAEYLAGMEEQVVEMARSLPPGDPAEVGSVVSEPPATVEAGVPVEVTWIGGTNDMPPPVAHLERQTADGWTEVTSGPSGELYLLFEAPDRWTASWRAPEAGPDPLRFRIEGEYRSPEPGGDPDPLWDPDGANRSYDLTSAPFTVTEP
ncbi:MAG: neutral/alkaline non-lysosomal ceramidase N-terminal domain-containing protein [Myxococcota bacterium]